MSFILLILMNLAVIVSIYLTIFLIEIFFGVKIDDSSVNGLLILSFIVGFSGALISLFFSKQMAKWGMGVKVIETPESEVEAWLIKTISRLAKKAGIGMPEVGIFEGAPNAFATGWNRNDALVAVSTGLLESMNEEEIEGVLAHEISHIKNGDMITMTLLQGVLNTFVFFLSRFIASIVSTRKDGERDYGTYYLISFILEMLLSVFATMLAMWFSRFREYRADEGAVVLAGATGIYNALAKLGNIDPSKLALSKEYKAFGFVGFIELFASHPPIEKRLENIEKFVKERGL